MVELTEYISCQGICDLRPLFDMNSAARAREDVEKLDTRARKKMMRLRHLAMVSYWSRSLLFGVEKILFQSHSNLTSSSDLHW